MASVGEIELIDGTGLFWGGVVEPPFPPPQPVHQSAIKAVSPERTSLDFRARVSLGKSDRNIGV